MNTPGEGKSMMDYIVETANKVSAIDERTLTMNKGLSTLHDIVNNHEVRITQIEQKDKDNAHFIQRTTARDKIYIALLALGVSFFSAIVTLVGVIVLHI